MNYFVQGVYNLFEIYFWVILLRCLLSFVPSIDWERQPFAVIKDSTDVYLNLFRRIVPPINGLDFSPIIAIIVLQILENIVIYGLLQIK